MLELPVREASFGVTIKPLSVEICGELAKKGIYLSESL